MKQILSLMAAAIALAGVGSAMAASSVDLSVKGSITPVACTPTLSKGGLVGFGKLPIKDMTSFNNKLPPVTFEMSVNCTGPALFAIKSNDNRSGSSADNDIGGGGVSTFGLGWVNGDKKIGWYTLKIDNAQADGTAQPVIESVDGQTWFDVSSVSQAWQPSWFRSLRDSASEDLSPTPMQVMSFDILLETSIRHKVYLPADQEFPINGSATLDVIYL